MGFMVKSRGEIRIFNIFQWSRLRLSVGLILVAILSFILWLEFRLITPHSDEGDTYRYIANGLSLLNSRHPFVEAQSYDEFSNRAVSPIRMASYPNQLYSLSIASLIRSVSAYEGRFALWPIWIPSLAATVIGFCFLYLLFCRFLPEPDAWLGLAVLGFHVLLMTTLARPLSDAVCWCFTMSLFWLAICRPGSTWTLGAVFGVALLFRLQVMIMFPFLLVLAQPSSCRRKLLTASLKAATSMVAVVLFFEGGLRLYVALPPGTSSDNAFGTATYYVRDLLKFIDHFGSIPQALQNFGVSLLALFRPIDRSAIGLSLILSMAVWWGRNDTLLQKQARIIWLAAFTGTLLPLLTYASENNPVAAPRYQIYSIPFYVLVALFSLNRLQLLFRKRTIFFALKSILVVLTMTGCVVFAPPLALRSKLVYGSMRNVYTTCERLPQLLTQNDLPRDGRYLVGTTLAAFLPDSQQVSHPTLAKFKKGQRNHELDGLIIKRQKDWSTIGSVIEDDRGVRFLRVYSGGDGDWLIYKREPFPKYTTCEDLSTNGVAAWTCEELSTKTIAVGLPDDKLTQPAKRFTILLPSPTGLALDSAPDPTINIAASANSTPYLQFEQQRISVSADVGWTANVRVIRTGSGRGAASVNYTTLNGTAIDGGIDYNKRQGTLTWTSGDVSPKLISIPIVKNSRSEPEEWFTITLRGATGVPLGSSKTCKVIISPND